MGKPPGLKPLITDFDEYSKDQQKGHSSFSALPYLRVRLFQVLLPGSHTLWIFFALDFSSVTLVLLIIIRIFQIYKVKIKQSIQATSSD